MSYCIDTSSLVDAWVRYYPPDTFPSMWDRLNDLVEQGQLISSQEVLRELSKKEDELLIWAKTRKDIMFKEIDIPTQKAVSSILLQFPKLVNPAKQRSEGDPFVIATAQVHQATVVTGEKKTGKLDKPKIPDVCQELGVPCIGILDLIKAEGWKF